MEALFIPKFLFTWSIRSILSMMWPLGWCRNVPWIRELSANRPYRPESRSVRTEREFTGRAPKWSLQNFSVVFPQRITYSPAIRPLRTVTAPTPELCTGYRFACLWTKIHESTTKSGRYPKECVYCETTLRRSPIPPQVRERPPSSSFEHFQSRDHRFWTF